MKLSSIYQSSLPNEQRKFLRVFLEYMANSRKGKNAIERVIIPAAGQFEAVSAALEAGFKKEQIFAYDTSFYSCVLGFLHSNTPLEYLDFTIVDPALKEMYEQQKNEIDRASVIFLAMKVSQLRPEIYYERCFADEIVSRPEYYRAQLADAITEGQERYKGINFAQRDLRLVIADDELTKNDLVVVSLPMINKKRDEQLNPYIAYDPHALYYDARAEFGAHYMESCQKPGPFLWHTTRDVQTMGIGTLDVIFAKQYSMDKYGYFLYTEPDSLGDFPDAYTVMMKSDNNDKAVKYKLFDADKDLDPNEKVTITEINKETALYYRDLFAHRLGATSAELYFGIFVGDSLLSVCGFNTSFLRRLQETYIFENFCFSISHNKYANLNRVSMMFLTSGEMKKHLVNVTLANSSYVDLKTFRTTCLTKYRKSKLNNRLLDVVHREKLPNDTYRLIYEHAFYEERSYKNCIEIFLKEDVQYKTSKEQAELQD